MAAHDEGANRVPPQGGYVATQCSKRASNDHDPTYDPTQKVEDTPLTKSLMEGGVVYETEIGERWLKALGKRIAVIPTCDRTPESKKKREELTMALLANPGKVEIIWNARFPSIEEDVEAGVLPRVGEPDFLIRLGKKANGTWAWAPGDVKHHASLEGTAKNRSWKVSTLDKPRLDDAVATDLGEGTVKLKPNMQLAHYRRMLEHFGFAQDVTDGSPYWAAIIGKEGVLVWRNLDEPMKSAVLPDGSSGKFSAQKIYDAEYEHRIAVIRRARERSKDASLPVLASPEWKTECKTCPWREVCHDELRLEMDHITLLPGVTPDRARAHYAQAVTTISGLAKLDHRTAAAVDLGLNARALLSAAASADETAAQGSAADLILANGGNAEAVKAMSALGFNTVSDLTKLCSKTASYSGTKPYRLADSIDQARVSKVQRVHRARGCGYVSIPRAAIEIDVDIEDSNGFVYLIGARARGYRKRGGDEKLRFEMHSFVTWEQTPEAEAKVFADFWTYLTGMVAYAKANKYGLRVFHYTRHEDHAFREMAKRHAGFPGVPTLAELDEFLNSEFWVDLFPIVSTQMLWPTEELTLKKLAGHVGFLWRDEAPGGDNSIAWYKQAITASDEAAREESRARIIAYNEDDVVAQLEIRDWINRFGETRRPGVRLPGAEILDTRFGRRRTR